MITSSARRTTYDGRLCFASITEDDEANYNCAVTNTVGGNIQKLSKPFYVEVTGNSKYFGASWYTVHIRK